MHHSAQRDHWLAYISTPSLLGVESTHMLPTLHWTDPPLFDFLVSGNHQSQDMLHPLWDTGSGHTSSMRGILSKNHILPVALAALGRVQSASYIAGSQTCTYKQVRDTGILSRLFINLHLTFPATPPIVTSTCQGTGTEEKFNPTLCGRVSLYGPGHWIRVMSEGNSLSPTVSALRVVYPTFCK